MSAKPPVLIMCNHMDGLGGVERVAHALSSGLSGRGFDVSLQGIRPTTGARLAVERRDYEWGFMSDRMEVARPAGGRHSHAVQEWQRGHDERRREAVDALGRTLERYREGIFICMQVYTMEHVAQVGLDQSRARRPRTIGQYHSSFGAARHTGDLRRLERQYKDLDKFVLLSREDARSFQESGFDNTGVQVNPLPPFPSAASVPRENLLVSLARYHQPKTLDHALRAWAALSPEFPTWRFELYGDGPDRQQLQDLIDELGIGGTARLMGTTDDVGTVLRRARLHVLSSQYEGLPMVLAEAMSMGVPSVTYDSSPGVREIVTDQVDGLVVPKNATAELEQGLRDLMADDLLRDSMAEAGRESAGRYAPDVVLDQWEELFERTMR